MIKLLIFDAGDIFYDTGRGSKIFNLEFNKFLKRHDIKDLKRIDIIWDYLYPLTLIGGMTEREAHKIQIRNMGISKKYLYEFESANRKALKSVKLKEASIKRTLYMLNKNKYVLTILSDSSLNQKETTLILKRLGIEVFFDRVFVSSEIKHTKPDKESYLTVIKYFGVKASETIFVGHDKDELDGAKKLRIKSISYRGKGLGDYNIKKFSRIYEIVKNLK